MGAENRSKVKATFHKRGSGLNRSTARSRIPPCCILPEATSAPRFFKKPGAYATAKNKILHAEPQFTDGYRRLIQPSLDPV